MIEPRVWTGGAYDEREGIRVTPGAQGITIVAWYDGGPMLEVEAVLTWAEIDEMKPLR